MQRYAQEGGEKVSPLLELLPPFAERILYHGFYAASPLSSGSAVALEIWRGRIVRGLFLCHPWWMDDYGVPFATFKMERPCFKIYPCQEGGFSLRESHCFSAGRLVIENYKSPNIALEPYLCILSGQNQFYWESVSYRIRFPCAASAQGLLTAWVHTRSGDICYKTDRETAEDKMINYWIPFS